MKERGPHSLAPADLSGFRDPVRAGEEMTVLRSCFSERTLAALLPLLASAPDPDQALGLMERLIRENAAEAAARLDADHVLLHYAIAVFGHSHWLGEALIHNPDLLSALQRDLELGRLRGIEDFLEQLARFRVRFSGGDVSTMLARFRKREYVRIALRDLLGLATLAETTAEISALADALIGAALRHGSAQMNDRYGRPLYADAFGRRAEARFTVLSLGKLGGNELNYSSDIDLLYIYDGGEACGDISLREYFIRQAQMVSELLSRPGPEGALFRIDLRLRPQGQEGEPAVALNHALHYYTQGAHDWELQALIKARHSAGDAGLAQEFIRAVLPRVYVSNINFAAIETATNSRRKIGEQRRRSLASGKRPFTIDVKLDRGGIRDIEFLLQCLQRVYGGEEPWLRAAGTQFALQKLHDKGHLLSSDFQELSGAYEFLRIIEHRLQLQRGQQLHALPSSPWELHVLARSIAPHHKEDAAGLLRLVREKMGRVAAIYERIVHQQKQREKGGPEAAPDAYYIGPRELSFDQLVHRLKSDSPGLHRLISNARFTPHGRKNLHRFLGSAMSGGERYTALLENSACAANVIALLEASDYLADMLALHPSLVQMLGEALGAGASPHGSEENAFFFSFDGLARGASEALAMLRKGFRQANFALAARDVLAPRNPFQSMKQSTHLADEAIRCALRLVQGEGSLAVFALGRLGTEELDIASDADLLFVRAPEANHEEARLAAERLVQALSAYTKDGPLFAVDTRLRPHGGEGELVISPAQLERYLAEEAQPWEALTYSKLRFLAGRKDVSALLLPRVWNRIIESRARKDFAGAVAEMRVRLEKSNRYSRSFKLAAGGFYDIDFIASYLVLSQGDLARGNTEQRLQRLFTAGLLAPAGYQVLRDAALLYRTVDHAIRLVTGRALPELPSAEHAREFVAALVAKIRHTSAGTGDLQAELQETQSRVRAIFHETILAAR